jgi:hypothetical protein
MPTRAIKPRSERGSLKDLANNQADPYDQEASRQLTASETRLQKLYQRASQDPKMQQALGIITTDYISDKNALPLSVYRLRKIVNDIKSRSSGHIIDLEAQFSEFLSSGISQETIDLLIPHQRIKTASAQKPPVFRRVSE